MIGLLAVMAASMGCYTLLKHPGLKSSGDTTEEYQAESVSHGNDCLSCHNSADLDRFAIGVPRPRPYTSPWWDYYYDWPWWNSYYANPTSDDQAENEKRPFDRRRQSQPPEAASSSSGAAPAPAELPTGSLARPAGSGDNTSNPPPASSTDSGKREGKRSSGDSDDQSGSSNRRERKP